MGETMICTACQREIAQDSNFCYYCGARQYTPSAPARPAEKKRLMRSSTDVKIAGVCAGIADYLDVDPTLTRLLWAILSVVPGGFVGGIFAYLLAWFIMPKAPLPLPAAPQTATPHAAESS